MPLRQKLWLGRISKPLERVCMCNDSDYYNGTES